MVVTFKSDDVQRLFAYHIPLYRWRKPYYQQTVLEELAGLWDGHDRVLDVGGGTGIMAHAIHTLLPAREVVAVDIEDRFLPNLGIESQVYDGRTLPFETASFDAITINNVLHHVPEHSRAGLLHECRRVAGRGPVYIKDHIALSRLDHLRLGLLDWIGNVPFGGMVEARYLGPQDWASLRAETNHAETGRGFGTYRNGPAAILFPNRLEVVMKWVPA